MSKGILQHQGEEYTEECWRQDAALFHRAVELGSLLHIKSITVKGFGETQDCRRTADILLTRSKALVRTIKAMSRRIRLISYILHLSYYILCVDISVMKP